MVLKKPFIQSSTLHPSANVAAQKSRSKAGQAQMMRKTEPYVLRFCVQALQSEGRRMEQVKQRKAMIRRGMRMLPRVLAFYLAFTNATTTVKRMYAPQKIQSLYALRAKMVSKISNANSTSSRVTIVPILKPLPSSRLIACHENTISENFHSIHEQMRLMATATGEPGPLMFVLNICVESVYNTVFVYEETFMVLLQKQDACTPTAQKSMAQIPTLMPTPTINTTKCKKQLEQQGASSRSSSLPFTGYSLQTFASVYVGLFADQAGGYFCISTSAGWLLP